MDQLVSPPVHQPEPLSAETRDVLVDVRDLHVRLVSRDMDLTLLHGLTFSLKQGEVLCLLGESGSGKTVAMRSLMRLLPRHARISGKIGIGGVDILALKPRELPAVRGGLISMVFQEPATALD